MMGLENFQEVLIYARIVGYMVLIWALFILAVRHKQRNKKMFWAMLSMAGFHGVLLISLVLARVGAVEITAVRLINDLGLTPFLFFTASLVVITIVEMDREHLKKVEHEIKLKHGSTTERVNGFPNNPMIPNGKDHG